jgi:hypothetical protein
MKLEYLFPTIMIGLNIASAIYYGFQYNWRMAIYWIATATLTSCVTYGK